MSERIDRSAKKFKDHVLQQLLEKKTLLYNTSRFIEHDPVSIPHKFIKKQDVELMGFWSAVLSWGFRPTIIKKAMNLIELMEGEPFEFIMNHQAVDLKRFLCYKHRTFNGEDALYFIDFFKNYYSQFESLEDAFLNEGKYSPFAGLEKLNRLFFPGSEPCRTRKHVSRPSTGSTCKRLNMFLRWMVREDGKVDFGLWKRIKPSELIIPLDVHVDRVARKLGLITRKQSDWTTAAELTARLATFDQADPVKYDFALFNMGIEGFI